MFEPNVAANHTRLTLVNVEKSNPTAVSSRLFVATLDPQHIDLYASLHSSMPDIHRIMMEADGCLRLVIWRDGLQLYMLAEKKKPLRELTTEELAARKHWHEDTRICFSEPWRPVEPLFVFDAMQ